MFKKLFSRFLIFLFLFQIIPYKSSASNLKNNSQWKLKYLKKIDHIEQKDISLDYIIFYKIEISNDIGKKKAFIIGKTYEKNKISFHKKYLKKRSYKQKINKNIWKLDNIEKHNNLFNLNLFYEYDIYYQTEIINEKNEKKLIILCQTKDSKTNEDKKEEAKEHIKEGLKEVFKGAAEGGLAIKSIYTGDAAAAAIEIEESAEAFQRAYDEFMDAYECYNEMKTTNQEKEEKTK